MNNTKNIILEKALELFSRKGYDATTLREIAKEVGITQSSLYKHYKSKEDIFISIFNEMKSRYDEESSKDSIHITNDSLSDGTHFSAMNRETIADSVINLINYSIDDEFVSRTRKLITIEQFRNKEISKLYTQRYVDRMVDYHKALFSIFKEKGLFFAPDIDSAALQYTAPIFTLLGIIDRESDKREECITRLRKHVTSFIEFYSNGRL